jgi:hypothetical protein
MSAKTTKSIKKSAAAKEASRPARSFARTTGEDIIAVCEAGKVKAPSAASKLAQDKELTKKELIGLRDDVNAISGKLREDGKKVLALALAHVNMSVQRLSRTV